MRRNVLYLSKNINKDMIHKNGKRQFNKIEIAKRKDFAPVVQRPDGIEPVGYIWVFM